MAAVVAGDAEPGTVRDGGVPRRENGWCGVGND